MEITLHTGCSGDCNTIHVDWFDENGIRQKTDIEVNVQNQDKPRQLEIILNGALLATVKRKVV
jgi:hypothetical protein